MELFKSAAEAASEVRSSGQTGITPGDSGAPEEMFRQATEDARQVRSALSGVNTPTPRAKASAPAQPAMSAQDFLNGIASGEVQAPGAAPAQGSAAEFLAGIAAQGESATPEDKPADVSYWDSFKKGWKGVMVTWDFLANKLEKAVTGKEADTAPILEKGIQDYQAMQSDKRIAEMIELGDKSENWREAGSKMLSYIVQNPGVIGSFLAENAAPVLISLPAGGIAGGATSAAVGRTALSVGTKAAITEAAVGATINSSAVVLGSLGTNYIEGLDKFNGDKAKAEEYATTKTLNEVPANAIAGAFVAVNPFTRLASRSPTAAAVGNTAFQINAQGIGGATGAYQAAKSVGEDIGYGQLLAEYGGEALTGPIDLYQARREARKAITPPGQTPPDATQAAAGSTPPPAPPAPEAPVDAANTDTSSAQSAVNTKEFDSARNSTSFMAAMYSRADDTARAALQATNPNINLEALSQDANLVMDGLKIMDSNPAFVARFSEQVGRVAPMAQNQAPSQTTTDAPFDGGVNVNQMPPQDFVPAREKLRQAQDLAQEGQLYAEGELITKEQADKIKTEKAAAPVNTEANTPIPSQPSPLAQLSQTEQQIRANQVAESQPTDTTDLDFTQEPAQVESQLPQTDLDFTKPAAPTFETLREKLVATDKERLGANSQPTDYLQLPVDKNVQSIADALGVTVYGFRYTGKNTKVKGRLGSSAPGGVVLLNVDKADAHMFVMGHEVYHELVRRNPEQAKVLEAKLMAYITEEGQQAYREALAKRGYQPGVFNEEMVGDMLGQAFRDPAFWSKVNENNPSLVQKVLAIIEDMLEKFGKMTKRTKEIQRYMTDYEKVRDMLADFVATGKVPQEVEAKQVSEPAVEPAPTTEPVKAEKPKKPKKTKKVKFEAPRETTTTEVQKTENGNVSSQERTEVVPPAPKASQPVVQAADVQVQPGETKASEQKPATESKDLVKEEYKELYRQKTQDTAGLPVYQQVPILKQFAAELKEYGFTDEEIGDTLRGKRENGQEFGYMPDVEGPSLSVPAADNPNVMTGSLELERKADAPDVALADQMAKESEARRQEARQERMKGPYSDAQAIVRIEDKFGDPDFSMNLRPIREFVKDGVVVGKIFQGKGRDLFRVFNINGLEGSNNYAVEIGSFDGFVANALKQGATIVDVRQQGRLDIATKADVTAEKENLAVAPTPKEKKSKFFQKQGKGTFDDDTGGVMGNLARSGAMGQDAAIELENKEKSAALAAAIREREKRASQRRIQKRVEAASVSTSGEVKAIADTAKQEIPGVLDQGYLRAEQGPVGVENKAPATYESGDEINNIEDVRTGADNQSLSLFETEKEEGARQLADAVSKGEMDVNRAIRMAYQEGIGQYNLVRAMRQYGIDPTPAQIKETGFLATNHTLRSFIRESGYNPHQATEMWLRSYDNLTNKEVVELTKDEQLAYDMWSANRAKYINRLSEQVKDNAPYMAGTLDDVFPNVLFTQFSLDEMRNPSTIDEPLQSMVRGLFEDPANAWLSDIRSVLTIRPDFEAQVFDALTEEEATAYREFSSRELREAMSRAEMISKSPAYNQLAQLSYLSPEMYIEYQGKIKMAMDSQLSQILHEANEMNDRAKVAIENGADPSNTIEAQMREYMGRDEKMAQNPDEMEDDNSDGTALFKRGRFSGVVPALAIKEHLTVQFANWKTQPEYTVVQNANQLADDVRERLTSRFDNGAFKGALDPKTGHIYLFSDFMENVQDAEFVMFHELYGHWGMRAFLGDKMDAFLENQYKLNNEIRETANRLRKEAAEMGMPMGKLESVEEAISDIAANGDTSLFRQVIGKMVAWLRQNGFETVAKWMDSRGESELAYVLAQAKKSARGQGISPLDGAPSNVRYAANKLPIEIFSSRDGKTTGYARIDPITGYWNVATIQDIKSGDFSVTTVEDYADALAMLQKVGTVARAKDRSTRVDVTTEDIIDIPDTRNIKGWRRAARYLQIKAQNMYLPVFEVAEFLKRNGIQNTIVEALKLYEGKTKYFIDAFENKYQVPIQQLLGDIGKKGGDQDFIDLFLLARHAAERNKAILDVTGGQNTAGSGMAAKGRTDKQGNYIPGYVEILQQAKDSAYAEELEKLGALTDSLSKDKLNYMLAHNLISQNQYDALSKYEHYVNLSGNEQLNLDQGESFKSMESVLGGRAFNLRGSDARRALGRGTLPVDILQNTMNAYVGTVIRGQKNTVVRAILDMIESNPDPTFAVVEEVETRKTLNTERLINDKKILKVIGDAPTEVSGKQFVESLAFKVKDGQLDADEAVQQLRERIREAEARRDIDTAEADAAIKRVSEQVVISGRLSPDGYVTTVEDQTTMTKDNVLVVKVDGKPVKIVFKEKGLEFVNAISGMSMQSRSDTLNALGAWGRFFSQLVTSWNPAWVPINGIRDFQTALTNMATDPRVGAKLANEMRKKWMESYRTAFRYQVADQANKSQGFWGGILASRSEKYPLSASEAAMYERFRRSGAETFFLDRKNLEETIETMNRHMNGPQGMLDWTKGKMEGIGAAMELMTMPMETAPRFAVFKTLVENGWSDQEAAIYAKELTVNFNLKGSSQWLRSLYVFANPSIQGTYRLFQDYSRGENGVQKFLPSNRFATVMGGWMMLGILGNFLARGLGGSDDDKPGLDKLDQIPHHKRSTSFILVPDVPGMAMPVGYGINVFFTAGHYMPDIFTGKSDATQVAGKIVKTAFDAFAPIGSGAESKTLSGQIIKTVAPSMTVPLIEAGMNENRFGAPIFKEQSPFSDVKEASSYMHFDTANPISRGFMHGLNSVTGGTRYKSGLIDVNPGVVDHFISSYLPGLFTEAYKGAGLAVRAARGEEIKRAPLPLVDRLTARVPEGYDAGAMRRAKEVVDTVVKEINAIDTTQERRKELRQQYPGVAAAKAVLTGTEQEIKGLRKQLEAIERDPRISDEAKVNARNKIKESERRLQNRAVEATLRAGFTNEIIND